MLRIITDILHSYRLLCTHISPETLDNVVRPVLALELNATLTLYVISRRHKFL